ncbi:TPA: HD domain-containing phosphohydrolase [Klebsiella pneumoniae]
MRIALKSALMLTTRVIQIINPELHRHMQRTALIALTLAQRLELPDERQQTIFCAALLHDIGVLGDKRTIHSLDAIDNIHDPHQRQGVAMLEGLATFQSIVPFIRDHHFSPNHRGSREQHIVYFADAFERLLPADSHVAAWPTRAVVEQFVALHREIDPPLCDILCEVAENANFWQHLHPGHIQRLLEIIGPINTRYLDIHGLKDVCLLIAKIVDTYSSFTATHSIMVGEIARQLARWMQLPEPTCQQIQIAGYLHDIGKVYIPLSILEKEGELDDEELSQVREHSYMTGELLSDYSELGDIINWASNHHEKMDGSGYPLHLEKEHLTLADRIISIADIFTALTEDRPYRKGMAWQEALQIMETDVINGALDRDVFLVLRHHAETLHAIILQTLEHPRSEHRP